MTRTAQADGTARAFHADAAELLSFFDELDMFSELDGPALPSTAPPSTAFCDTTADVASLLTTPVSPPKDSWRLLHDVPSAWDAYTSQSPPSTEPLHANHNNCLDLFDFNFQVANAGASTSSIPLGSTHAPLAFHSDYDSDPTSVASDPMAHEEGAIDEQQAKQPMKKKSTSQRQKEELTYLRGKVGELESALENIKDDITQANSVVDAGAAQVVDRPVESSVSLWELAAKRQLEEKNRAKLENMQLKQQIAGQIKFAKSLERMLRKRRIWDVLQEDKQHRFMEHSAKDSEIFAMLTNNVNARARSLDGVFDAQRLSDTRTALSESSIIVDDDDGMRIDFTNAITMPFDFRKVSNVVWKNLRMKKLANMGMDTQFIEHTDDLVVMKRTKTLGNDAYNTTIRSVCKRIQLENRVLVLWETLIESKGSVSRGLPTVQLITKGCGKITRCDDTVGGSPTSLLQSFVCVVPNLKGVPTNSESGDDWRSQHSDTVGLLTELVISSHKQNAQISSQFIENALFDDLIKDGESNV